MYITHHCFCSDTVQLLQISNGLIKQLLTGHRGQIANVGGYDKAIIPRKGYRIFLVCTNRDCGLLDRYW